MTKIISIKDRIDKETNTNARQRLVNEEILRAEKLGMSREEYRKWQNNGKYYTPLQIYDMLETVPIRGGSLVRLRKKCEPSRH